MIVNPCFVYIFSFSIAIALYILGWAGIYPRLGLDIFVFFISTFLIATVLSVFFGGRGVLSIRRRLKLKGLGLECIYVLGFIFEFSYLKSIPFFEILVGNDFDYSKFGIPVLHVLIMTYASAVGVLRFYNYILEGGKLRFFASIMPFFMFFLIYNRGAIVIQLVSYFFVYFCLHKMKLRFVFLLTPALIVFMYFFGVLGNMRSGEEVMEETLQPTKNFYELGIPKEFLWAYAYITSPVSNFEYVLEELNCESPIENCSDFTGLVVSEFMPDVLGKRIANILNVNFQISTPLVVENLNVTTTFSRAYYYFGWIGIFLMFFWIFGLFLIFEKIFKNSSLYVPVRAIICSMMAFSFFANMISFAGIVLQLFWMMVFKRALK